MSRDLSGKVAIVTGGSRGIGKATVLELASAGATVVIAGVSDSAGTLALAREIQGKEDGVIAIKTDVTSPEEVKRLVDAVMERLGQIHILVNNAGITRDGLLMRMKDEDWDAVLNTNLRGAFLCTRSVLGPMIKNRWGRIINIASVVGLLGNAGQVKLYRRQGRSDRSYQEHCQGGRIQKYYSERSSARLYRDGHDQKTQPAVEGANYPADSPEALWLT